MDAPPVITSAPRRSVLWLTIALPLALGGLVLFLFNPSQYGFYPRCVLYTTTGIYCPGCGALRAMHYLTHGQLLTALRYNPVLVLSLPFVAYMSGTRAWDWLAKRPVAPFVLKPKTLVILGVLLTIFTILRNIRVAPFTYLAPP